MKRCPSCNFPNIDSDRTCFKCGTSLPEEAPMEFSHASPVPPKPLETPKATEPEVTLSTAPSPPTSPAPAPDEQGHANSCDELKPKANPVFDSGANVSNFIHTPTEPPLSKTTETHQAIKAAKEACATSDIPLPQAPPPPLTTATPKPMTPARIIPKYKALNILSVLAKVIGILFGLLLMALGTGVILTFPNILGITVLTLCIVFGIISMVIGFVIAAILGWLNDAECNQRKQIELLGHIYHKINQE